MSFCHHFHSFFPSGDLHPLKWMVSFFFPLERRPVTLDDACFNIHFDRIRYFLSINIHHIGNTILNTVSHAWIEDDY